VHIKLFVIEEVMVSCTEVFTRSLCNTEKAVTISSYKNWR